MLFAACSSSGLRRPSSTTPDGSSSSIAGTGGTSQPGTDGTGGTSETGGVTSSGGVTGAGSVTNTGGVTSSGGLTVTGGVTNTGGVTDFGGVTDTGGATTSGGITKSGGATNSGGVASSGGLSDSGGIITSGGVTSSGGVTKTGGVISAGGVTAAGGAPTGHFQMEKLDRGVVAVVVAGGVYVGWRMFGYEYDTRFGYVSYNLYRDGNLVKNVIDSTNYLDASGTAISSYTVAAVITGVEGPHSSAATPWAQNYLSIPLSIPPPGPNGGTYSANDASPGDLDGDGQLDIVLKWDPSNSKDPSTRGVSDAVFIDGIKLDGTRLWRIDVGQNIRAGAHDTQFSVYDFDGDGKAEVAFKTAPGTKDGKGNYLHTGPAAGADNTADYRDATQGVALGGPEWLTVFSGSTGEELATVEYPVPYGTVAGASAVWGDATGNRSHRYNGGVSFVSDTGVGKTATGRPSIITQRGHYARLTISALNWRDGALTKVWTYDSGSVAGNEAYSQGNHSLMTADVDGDGALEIIPGSSTINSDGTFRCTTSMGHGDAMHVGILIKGKGIHVFMPHETASGADCHSPDTCAFTFNATSSMEGLRGVAEWVSPSNTASASCSSQSAGSLYCADGSAGAPSAGNNFLIYWDADESRELLDGTSITKAGGGTLLNATGCSGNNSTRNTPTLTADLLGDWREELVLRTTDNTALRVYTTTDVTKRRIYTLMHDPTYRMQVSFEQSSYNQPPHVGFHIGAGMADPPKPDIYVR
jgi:hypothetical protein